VADLTFPSFLSHECAVCLPFPVFLFSFPSLGFPFFSTMAFLRDNDFVWISHPFPQNMSSFFPFPGRFVIVPQSQRALFPLFLLRMWTTSGLFFFFFLAVFPFVGPCVFYLLDREDVLLFFSRVAALTE